MRGAAFVALLALAACATDEGVSTTGSAELQGWRTAAGNPPSKAELAAVMAACQDRAKNGPIEACLVDLGLRRVN